MKTRRIVSALVMLAVIVSGPVLVLAQDPPAAPGQPTEATPARVSYIHGEVSFWRPGAQEWAEARVNTPLAPGDLLYTGQGGNVEVQFGPRAFLRAGNGTQIGLDNQEPDFVQFRVMAGHAALDLRELPAGHTVEIATPNAAFTVERTGYYHVDLTEDSATFRTHRGGSATMTPAGGAHRLGQLELPAHGLFDSSEQYAKRLGLRLRIGDARPARKLAGGRDVRSGVGARDRGSWLGALQHGPVDLGPALRLDLAR